MRAILAKQLEMIGQQLNLLRMDLLREDYSFTAGIVRAAEETILLAFTMMNESPESEL